MQAPNHALELLHTIKLLQGRYKVVLVHGGGAMVEELLSALGLTSHKLDGLRITPTEQIPYITGALAGTANKQLCSLAIQAGIVPVGLSLADGNICEASQISEDLGAVGSVQAKDPLLLALLNQHQMLAIISSIGADSAGNLLNVNADQAATVIAQLLQAELLLLSDVPGVLDAQQQLICELDSRRFDILVKQKVIKDGMIVKVQAALTAANSLGRGVTISSWKTSKNLLGLLQHKGIGTKVLPSVQTNNLT